jgi:hypothetical protein
MANTRFNYDECRTIKKLQESTDPSRYILDTPGPGARPPFMLDTQIVSQKWAANLYTNSTQLESELLGINRVLTNCDFPKRKPDNITCTSHPISYPVNKEEVTESSRLVLPAFLFRSLPQNMPQYLPLNPQENICMPFENNLSTRILEKDYFIRREKVEYIKTDNGEYLVSSSRYNTQPQTKGEYTSPFQHIDPNN